MITQQQKTKHRTSLLHWLTSHSRTVLLFLYILLSSSTLFAQQWERFIAISDTTNYANEILETPEGDILVVAHIGDGSSSDSLYLTKLDAYGNTIWETTFGTNTYDGARSMILTDDGGCLIGGYTFDMPASPNAQCYLVKVDSDGNVQWEQQYGGDGFDRIHGIVPADDGGYVFGGWIDSDLSGDVTSPSFGGDDYWIVKIDASGLIQWDRRFGGSESDKLYDLANTADGGYIAVGTTQSMGNGPSDILVVKINADGSDDWQFNYGDIAGDEGFNIELTDDGGYIIGGVTFNPSTGDSDMYLVKLAANGQETWAKPIGGDLGEWGSYAVQTNDGGYAIAGSTRSFGSDSLDIFMVFTDANGDSIHQVVYEGGSNLDNTNALSKTADGGFLIAAQSRNSEAYPHITSEMYLLKTGPMGQTLTTTIEGSAYWDSNGDCIEDTAEAGFEDWLIVLESNERTFYATTDADGNYSAYVDTGLYEISIIPPNEYWAGVCGIQQTIDVVSFYDTIPNVDFAMEADVNCYHLEADISTAYLQQCEDAVYTVRYCNTGTVSGFGTFVEIELDDDFILNSVSQPYTLNGNQLTVGVGTVAPGVCDSFQISVNLDCTTAVEGQTHSVGLNIVPNLFCTPASGWDNSSVSIEAVCEMDSVRFTLTNDGTGDMNDPQHYIIIIDDLVAKTGPYQLPEGGSLTITEAAEGATLRMETPQAENHPGRSFPSMTIEGCGTNTSGGISLGFVNQFAEDDANNYRSDDCQESVATTAPAMLRAFPKGHHTENYIKPNTDIEYHFRYQNTGPDTLENIIIENHISAALDITSLQPGASSHDYDFEITGEGLLRFTFENLQLPDSASNATQSHLFVKFRISQKPDLSAETVIYNQMSLHSDQQTVYTDSIWHTVEKGILYEPLLLQICKGDLYDDLFLVENDTIVLDTTAMTEYDLIEVAGIEALHHSFTTIDTTITEGFPYNGTLYEQDTTIIETYAAYNNCDSIVTTNIMLQTVGTQTPDKLGAFDLFPNPVNEQLYLQFTLRKKAMIGFEIKELLTGQTVWKNPAELRSAGEHQQQINMKDIPVGTYYICIQVGDDLLIQKLIKL